MLRPRVFLRCGLAAGLLVLGLAGCSGRPNAPALVNEPVYLNKQEGFRFRAPEGWVMHSRTEVPPGRLTVERLLVEYKRPSVAPPASLDLSMNDFPESKPLADCLEGRELHAGGWRRQVPPEETTVGGRSGLRIVSVMGTGKAVSLQEVVLFRRGQRVYFFTAIFGAQDEHAREEVRRSVASLAWEGGS